MKKLPTVTCHSDPQSTMSEQKYEPLLRYSSYEISSSGSVRNRVSGKLLAIQSATRYPVVNLIGDDKKLKRVPIHRLVAIQFIENPNNLPEVNHKDGNKKNYVVENLEWTSRKENIKHSIDTGLRKSLNKKGKAVEKIDPETGQVIATFQSVAQATRDVKLAQSSNIKRAMSTNIKAGGFLWREAVPLEYDHEEWKQLKSAGVYPLNYIRYSVSSLGRVRNDRDRKILNLQNDDGYKIATLSIAVRKVIRCRVHRLVASAFLIRERDDQVDVDHINGDRAHNHIDNLRWASRSENITYAIGVPVIQVDEWGNTTAKFPSVAQAARSAGCTSREICDALRGRKITVKGSRWKYHSVEKENPSPILPDPEMDAYIDELLL